MYVYIYMYAYLWMIMHFVRWILMGDPIIIMNALGLVVWVCAHVHYHRCIFILHCVHDHRGIIVSIYDS